MKKELSISKIFSFIFTVSLLCAACSSNGSNTQVDESNQTTTIPEIIIIEEIESESPSIIDATSEEYQDSDVNRVLEEEVIPVVESGEGSITLDGNEASIVVLHLEDLDRTVFSIGNGVVPLEFTTEVVAIDGGNRIELPSEGIPNSSNVKIDFSPEYSTFEISFFDLEGGDLGTATVS